MVIAAALLIVSFAPLLYEPRAAVRWWALGASLLFLALARFWATPLKPFNRLWTVLGLLLYRVVSPLALALLFYFAVVPVGVLMRALGKDPLRLRRDAHAVSYWIPRDPPGPPPQSMKNQF